MTWNNAQEWETSWWGNCANTLGEELKQLTYARRMGLSMYHNKKSPYNIDLAGKSVLDIGGGPASLLLKCENFSKAVVTDPLNIPEWCISRYNSVGVEYIGLPGEKVDSMIDPVDEVWIYNCLQHTIDPRKIVENALKVGGIVRIFEWLDTSINVGHPHTFTRETLDRWLGGRGRTERLNGENSCYGDCYYGVFIGRR